MKTSERLAGARRVVIKVGSSSITGSNEANLDRIVDLSWRLSRAGKQVILVSSGAIATASPLIGLTAKSEDLATSQALAKPNSWGATSDLSPATTGCQGRFC
ncbi:MAG: glutamate 5-kinase [Actinomycetota bacterium]